MITSSGLKHSLRTAVPICVFGFIVLTGCVTSDLTGAEYAGPKAELVLYPMASSNISVQCMIAAIDGQDVTSLQSSRLTTEYLIPAGSHTYGFVCEESVGSIPERDYRFVLTIETIAGGRYGLLRQPRRDGAACILIKDLGEGSEKPLAEYCQP